MAADGPSCKECADEMLQVLNAESFVPVQATPRPQLPRRFDVVALLCVTVSATVVTIEFLTVSSTIGALLPVGVLALWRYLWFATHYVRAFIFLKVRFPSIRREAEQRSNAGKVSRIYAVVSSYNIQRQHFCSVYRALLANAIDARVPMTVVASVTSHGDQHRLQSVYEEFGCPKSIEVVVQFQKGDGKRNALGMALRAIARRFPDKDALTVMLDGDIVLEPNALKMCLPFFCADPELAAVTTNNDAFVCGGGHVADWYALRHAQRHLLMSSLSLSGRLLVLTGRFSIYRTIDTICPEFIRILEQDEIQHWRLGKIRFLSGDDKSSWFFMLRQKRKLLYVPDVKAYGFEALPAGSSFVSGTSTLMFRWFGNMIRTSERAIRLGPRVATPFLWWCLVDQRISAWTALIGPMAAILLALIWGPIHLVHYLVWVAATRSGMALAFGMLWGRCRVTWPGLMLWNQIVGALLKGWIVHHPDRQSWTRQGIHSKASATATMRLLGALFYVTSFSFLVAITATILGYASPF